MKATVLLMLVGIVFGEVHHLRVRRRQSLMEKKIVDGTWLNYVKNQDLKKAIVLASGGSPLKDYSNVLKF